MPDVLIKVDGVSKKFCRSLRKSLWYGMQDLGKEISGRRLGHDVLRSDEFWAVKDVSFELKRGQCLGLIGHNGAGKTTLLRMLNGLVKPDQGRIEIKGHIGALISLGAGFNPVLTGRENIYVNASLLGLTKREIYEKLDEIVDFAGIEEFIDTPVQNYSSGMQVRLGFAVATSFRPDILILDEVLAVGDAAFRVKCFNRLQETMSQCAVVFVSHNMAQVTRICNQVLLLREGKVIDAGSDIGGIIAQYHERIEICHGPSLEGVGSTILHSVEFRDHKNEKCEVMQYGDSYSIVVDCELPDKARKNSPKLLITINDQEDVNVAQIYLNLYMDSDIDSYRLNLKFEKMQLNAGRYWLTTSILLGRRGELSCVLRRATSITVMNSHVGYAPVILDCCNIEYEYKNLP